MISHTSLKQFQTKNVMFNIIVDMYFDTVNWIKNTNQKSNVQFNVSAKHKLYMLYNKRL